jgi:hypothetical protein
MEQQHISAADSSSIGAGCLSAAMIACTCVTFTGKNVELGNHPPDATVRMLKVVLSEQDGIAVQDQRLFCIDDSRDDDGKVSGEVSLHTGYNLSHHRQYFSP